MAILAGPARDEHERQRGHRVAIVGFGLSLVFEISALLAEVKAGKLVALHSGRCDVDGALAIQDINTITKQPHIDLPGMLAICAIGSKLTDANKSVT
jgi:hypothetical protein